MDKAQRDELREQAKELSELTVPVPYFKAQAKLGLAILSLLSDLERTESAAIGYQASSELDQEVIDRNVARAEKAEARVRELEDENETEERVRYECLQRIEVAEKERDSIRASLAVKDEALREAEAMIRALDRQWDDTCGHYDWGPEDLDRPYQVIRAAITATPENVWWTSRHQRRR